MVSLPNFGVSSDFGVYIAFALVVSKTAITYRLGSVGQGLKQDVHEALPGIHGALRHVGKGVARHQQPAPEEGIQAAMLD